LGKAVSIQNVFYKSKFVGLQAVVSKPQINTDILGFNIHPPKKHPTVLPRWG